MRENTVLFLKDLSDITLRNAPSDIPQEMCTVYVCTNNVVIAQTISETLISNYL